MPPSLSIIRIQKRVSLPYPSMEDLPAHLMVDILSRLPVKMIIHCKCVSKKWLDLVSESYFADLQLSRSPPGLMIHTNSKDEKIGYLNAGILRWTEVDDELDHHHLHHDPVMSLELELAPILQNSQIHPVGSVNGLLCLWQYGQGTDNTYICNPITREYMILPRQQYYREGYSRIVYCFGVSSLTREYKVIRIFQGDIPPDSTSSSRPSLLEAEVYTLGTGRWRSLGRVPYWLKGGYGTFINGHAHWTVIDQDSPEKLCAFEFDKETFELFPSPSAAMDENQSYKTLGVLKGCLCRCDSNDSRLTVWVMKEYGIKKSWHKELVIEKSIYIGLDLSALKIVYVLGGLKDGTILMASYQDTLFFYCPRRKTIVDKKIFGLFFDALPYHSGFHRLKRFENERVHVF